MGSDHQIHHSSDPFRVKTLKVVRVSDNLVITSEILVPKLSSRRLWDITVHEIIQHTVVNTDTENASLAKGVHHHDFLPPFEKRKVDGSQELHHGAPTKRLHQSAILPHRHHKDDVPHPEFHRPLRAARHLRSLPEPPRREAMLPQL